MELVITILIVVMLILTILIFSIKIIKDSTAIVIQRLGKYHKTLFSGVHFITPIIDKPYKTSTGVVINLKEQLCKIPPQPIATKDNITMLVDGILFFQIVDTEKYCYVKDNPILSIQESTTTTLRKIIGELDVLETINSKESIAEDLIEILNEYSFSCGIKITNFELKNVLPPKDIRDALENKTKIKLEKKGDK